MELNDFIAFDIYLKKNNIPFELILEGDQINLMKIDKYISNYVDLFKKFGIKLIETDKQFPHYFPEWT